MSLSFYAHMSSEVSVSTEAKQCERCNATVFVCAMFDSSSGEYGSVTFCRFCLQELVTAMERIDSRMVTCETSHQT